MAFNDNRNSQRPQLPKPERQLTVDQVHLLLAMFVRDFPVFHQVKDWLEPRYLIDRDLAYLVPLVLETKTYYEKHAKLPPFDVLVAEVNAWLERNHEALSDSSDSVDAPYVAEINKVLTWAADMSPQTRAKNRPQVLEYARLFLKHSLQSKLKDAVSDKQVSDLPDLLRQFSTQVNAVAAIGTARLTAPFPESLEDMPVTVTSSTGCSYFDNYMNGGHAPGEVYGFAAPYGVCKTTVACQLSVNAALHAQAAYADKRCDKLKVVYFVTYEEPRELIMPRFLSYAGDCDKTLLDLGKWDEMSRMALRNYKPYERAKYKEQLARRMPVPGEYERASVAGRQLNANLRIIDFSGADESMADAAGKMEEGIRSVIDKHQAELGRPGVELVVVDYVGAAADKYCGAHNKDPDRWMRQLIGKFPLRVGNAIAKPRRCPVWAFHQLSAKANSKRPGQAPAINDTGEAKNFMENCVFGFMVGNKTNEGMAVLTNCKQRRAQKRPDLVVFIDGQFSRVLDTEGAYRIDRGRIVAAADFNKIVDIDDPDGDTSMRLDDVGISVTRRH